jgi:hypothetical protein
MRCSDALNEADSHNRPQGIKCKPLILSVEHNICRKACFVGRPYYYCNISKGNEGIKAADLDDRSKFFLLSCLSICSVDLTDDGN